jgi:hypothetical protein
VTPHERKTCVIPAKARTQNCDWIPAYAGMAMFGLHSGGGKALA